MRLFHLIQQYKGVGLFFLSPCQAPLLAMPHIPGWGAHEARHVVGFHELTHVNPDHGLIRKKLMGQQFGQVGFPHSGGAHEQKDPHGTAFVPQSRS